MSDTTKASANDQWSATQAYTLAVVCLLIGIAGGWFIRGSQVPGAAPAVAGTMPSPGMGDTMPTSDQMKKMASAQAASLLERLKSEPNNPQLLANIGDIYYDTQQYSEAIDFYQRSLKIAPDNANVRTDMGTAMWFSGNADQAIDELNKALKYEPTKPNTLFNLGIVKWQGKMDVGGAVAAWQKLLATNPNYEAKDKVRQLIAQAQKHANVKPGTPAKPLSE